MGAKIAKESLNSGVVSNNGYIVGKTYDIIWFIGAPTIGLIVAFFFLNTGLSDTKIFAGEYN